MKYSPIGKKIKYYRQERDMTQNQLADKIGITWEMISRYERGASSPFEKVKALAEALSVDPLELLQDYYKSNNVAEKILNNIPLFTSSSKKFTEQDTQYVYNAPLWVTKKDRYAFAVDMAAVKSESLKIQGEGLLYISPNTQPSEGSLILNAEGKGLTVEEYKSQTNIVGVVIGREERL